MCCVLVFLRGLLQISAIRTRYTQCAARLFLYAVYFKSRPYERGILYTMYCAFVFNRTQFQISPLRTRYTQCAVRLFLCVAYLKRLELLRLPVTPLYSIRPGSDAAPIICQT